MARGQGKGNKGAAKRPALPLYFFLNDQIHKRLHVNRAQDKLTAWNYPEHKKVVANYSTVVRRHKTAFTTTQVCKMIGRGKLSIGLAMNAGMIEMPQYTYAMNEAKKKQQYMWREEDIMAVHEYYSSVHMGRPRHDGEVTSWNVPTARELRAMIHDEAVLYVKEGDNYVPTWRAKEY